MAELQDEYLRARAVLLTVRQLPGGGLLALSIYDALENNDAARVIAATRDAEAWLRGEREGLRRDGGRTPDRRAMPRVET